MAKKGTSNKPAQPTSAIERYGGRSAGSGGGIQSLLPLVYLLGMPIMMGIGYLVFINPLLKKLGLKDSKEDKAMALLKEQVKSSPIWTSYFYQTEGGDTMTPQEMGIYAQRIYDATRGGFLWGAGTSENEISGVFNQLGSTGNVSLLSEVYFQMYGQDLLEVLDGELDNEDFITYVATPISKYW